VPLLSLSGSAKSTQIALASFETPLAVILIHAEVTASTELEKDEQAAEDLPLFDQSLISSGRRFALFSCSPRRFLRC
jgi:hypothetical protein